jgi:hypothetical protein
MATLFYLSDLQAGSAPCASGISFHFPAMLALGLFKLTLLFGVPTWIGLRLIHRESGVAYALAGLAWGMLGTIWLSYAFRNGWSADLLPHAVFAGFMGAFTAATFWSIARSPTTKEGGRT